MVVGGGDGLEVVEWAVLVGADASCRPVVRKRASVGRGEEGGDGGLRGAQK